MHSGQVQSNLAGEFGFLGAAAGGIVGANSGGPATTIGVIGGATLGSIIGSFVTDDTYIFVAKVTVGIIKGTPKRNEKSITFSRSIIGDPKTGKK